MINLKAQNRIVAVDPFFFDQDPGSFLS